MAAASEIPCTYAPAGRRERWSRGFVPRGRGDPKDRREDRRTSWRSESARNFHAGNGSPAVVISESGPASENRTAPLFFPRGKRTPLAGFERRHRFHPGKVDAYDYEIEIWPRSVRGLRLI